jgi:hypothetical protein
MIPGTYKTTQKTVLIMETAQQNGAPRDPVVDRLTATASKLENAIMRYNDLSESADGSALLEAIGALLIEIDVLEGYIVGLDNAEIAA